MAVRGLKVENQGVPVRTKEGEGERLPGVKRKTPRKGMRKKLAESKEVN